MAFSQSTITEVFPPRPWGSSQISLSWSSSSPAGTWFQVYLDQALFWFGQCTSLRMPIPLVGPNRIDIGTVDPGEEQVDFSSSLPSTPSRRAQLTWLGGTFLGADIETFEVYGNIYGLGSFGVGGYGSSELADITAYPSGIILDGYGLGGYGNGGFGQVAGTYSYTSDPLTAGTWSFAIVPVDAAGNLGAPATTTVVIAAPPNAPAPFSSGARLAYTYSSGSAEATLTWNASPS